MLQYFELPAAGKFIDCQAKKNTEKSAIYFIILLDVHYNGKI